ncbi:MAG: DUF5666 domain-containing protein [Deltaproteobacteria bacterium]
MMSTGSKAGRRSVFMSALALIAAIAFLSGCGGGGGGGGTTPVAALPPAEGPPRVPAPVPDPVPDPTPTPDPVPVPDPVPQPAPGQPPPAPMSSGLFLGRGSVIVNGVQFSRSDNVAADNSVFIDDAPGTEADIRVGMIVKVRGSFGPTTLTGRYERVDAEPQLIGAAANPTASGFSVLNQSVTVTPFTVFEGVSRAPVAGTPVEVHGSFTGANAIEATYVRAAGAAKVQIRGVVDALDNAAGTLTIGSQQVNFTPPAPAGLAVGRFVEAEGVQAGAVVDATAPGGKVEIELVTAEAAGQEIEIEGSVEAGSVTATGFRLLTASGPVTVSFGVGTPTVFEDEDNSPVSSGTVLLPGNQVEVEGFMVDGILIAAEIELERKENVVLEGTVAGGTLFGLALSQPLADGTHVEVGGSVVPDGGPPFTVNVTRVTPIADPLRAGNLVLQGPVANVNAVDNTFSILGVAINLTGLQERDDPVLGLTSEYENAANIRIDRGNFMALLRNNVSVVKAKAIANALNPPFAGGIFNPRSGVEIEEHR